MPNDDTSIGHRNVSKREAEKKASMEEMCSCKSKHLRRDHLTEEEREQVQ